MLGELIAQSWRNLSRNRTRSLLTMLGIVWGIVAVAVLMSYGGGFRAALVRAFDAFGKSAVVIGRSNIVGKPMAQLLLKDSCTVTIAHSRTQDLPAVVAQADIVVAAVGIEPGTGPPTSIMWPNMEVKPIRSSSKKIGTITIQSLIWEMAPPHL